MMSETTKKLYDAVDEPNFQYHWVITEDLISCGEFVGTSYLGYKNEVPTPTIPFRLKDDDGEIYYRGLANDAWTENAFSPLDDFGMPNDGCTEIEYFVDGVWSTL